MTTTTAPATSAGVVFRSIHADDGAALQAFHRRLSADTVRSRFFGAHPELSDREATRFTSLDPAREAAVVAIVAGGIVAVGRYVRVGDGDAAEVAFVVDDDHQHHGVGSSLMRLIAAAAWAEGIRRLVADTLVTNRPMLGIFLHTPAAVTVLSTRRDGSVVHVVMEVRQQPRSVGVPTTAR
jgi:GNAT superfamily N-acetyltransferase